MKYAERVTTREEEEELWNEAWNEVELAVCESSDDGRERNSRKEIEILSYTSTQPRLFFACPADKIELCKVLEAI